MKNLVPLTSMSKSKLPKYVRRHRDRYRAVLVVNGKRLCGPTYPTAREASVYAQRVKIAARRIDETAQTYLPANPEESEQEEVGAANYIYFVLVEESGPIKIGFSTKPAHRLVQLQTANHKQLFGLICIKGGKRDEASLHKRFEKHHLHLEWFSPAEELLKHISSLMGTPREAYIKGFGLRRSRELVLKAADKLAGVTGADLSHLGRDELASVIRALDAALVPIEAGSEVVQLSKYIDHMKNRSDPLRGRMSRHLCRFFGRMGAQRLKVYE